MHSRFDIYTKNETHLQQPLCYKRDTIFLLRVYPANAQFQVVVVMRDVVASSAIGYGRYLVSRRTLVGASRYI